MNKKKILGSLSLVIATLGLSIVSYSFNHANAVSINKYSENQLTENNLYSQLPKNPYQIGDYYNATAYFKCSVGNASHNKKCPGGIVRKGNGVASIVVLFPNNYEIQYDFKNGNVTSTYDGKLNWGKSGDEWYIGIDNELFIIIPEAAVSGG